MIKLLFAFFLVSIISSFFGFFICKNNRPIYKAEPCIPYEIKVFADKKEIKYCKPLRCYYSNGELKSCEDATGEDF